MTPDEVLAGYRPAAGPALTKELDALDEHCRRFLELCPFVVLSTATPDGQPDVTPRGGEPGLLRVVDDRTLVLPDMPGNNRLDSLRKVVANPKVSLLCLVPGIEETLRLHGTARLTAVDDAPVEVVERGRRPRSVLVITVERAFIHCATALIRGRLWEPEAQVPRDRFASMSELMRAHAGDKGPMEDQDAMRRRYQAQL
jgi:PPOX class probable FMN-dependent enzyme